MWACGVQESGDGTDGSAIFGAFDVQVGLFTLTHTYNRVTH